eukprot:Awhi_evm1s884
MVNESICRVCLNSVKEVTEKLTNRNIETLRLTVITEEDIHFTKGMSMAIAMLEADAVNVQQQTDNDDHDSDGGEDDDDYMNV